MTQSLECLIHLYPSQVEFLQKKYDFLPLIASLLR